MNEADRGFVEAAAAHQRGRSHHARKQFAQALASFNDAIYARPDFVEALSDRGVTLAALGRHEESLADYARALSLRPDYLPALYYWGNALVALRRLEEALHAYEGVLGLEPNLPEALNNRANVLYELHRYADSLASYDRLLAIKPDFVEGVFNRASALARLYRSEEALAGYSKALTLRPAYPQALIAAGSVLSGLLRNDEAERCYARALQLNPECPYAAGWHLLASLACCNWADYDRKVSAIVDGVRARRRVIDPLAFAAVSDSPADQLLSARIWAADKCPQSSEPLWRGEAYEHDRIRVAYLSADFHDHATACLMAGLFERQDRNSFEIVAISFGPNRPSEMRSRLWRAFERFIDVSGQTDEQIARLIRDMEIDIAVDLKGYTTNARPGILAFRPAPVQVSYLGFPGTLGTNHIDYILADRTVIPEGDQGHYTERVFYLPDTYQVNDDQREIADSTPTRREAGLPDQDFVFCCFNNNHKIAPATFDIWMRLLKKVDSSVLWLLADNPAVPGNLRREAQSRGVSPERLVFAQRAPLQQHLARHRLADLFLDTLPYNAHTTASDALWAGLPVLSCMGHSFAGRVCASLLRAADLSELITQSPDTYEARALEMAFNPARLAALRAKLGASRRAVPLFDTDRFRRHVEQAYRCMWSEKSGPPVY